MNFYQELQLNQAASKAVIRQTDMKHRVNGRIWGNILGMQGAVFYRIVNNVFGALFGYLFFGVVSRIL